MGQEVEEDRGFAVAGPAGQEGELLRMKAHVQPVQGFPGRCLSFAGGSHSFLDCGHRPRLRGVLPAPEP